MRRRPLAAWLAIFAIALQALWPLVAQAKPKSVVLVPVCTVQGVTHYIELPKSGAPIERKAASQHEHCSFCTLGFQVTALPVAPSILFPLDTACSAPWSSEDSFLESQKRLQARSRAPPRSRLS